MEEEFSLAYFLRAQKLFVRSFRKEEEKSMKSFEGFFGWKMFLKFFSFPHFLPHEKITEIHLLKKIIFSCENESKFS